MSTNTSSTNIYIPNENESYMNNKQILFFKNKLEIWKQNVEIKNNQIDTQLNLLSKDIHDANSYESLQIQQEDLLMEKSKNISTIDKINVALYKIKNKTYGYCEYLNTPIGVKRLIAIPTASFSLESQLQFENSQIKRQH